MKVESFMRPLEPGQAVALSYGIGDFDRENHLFGHFAGLVDRHFTLTFGSEWDVELLMDALMVLSQKHDALWLDQLSIPQDETSIRSHLQNMPQIYHKLEVVILLPNAPCACLAAAFKVWKAKGLYTWTDGDFNITAVASNCLNAFPVSSHHFRLWTKLEFAYATSISIHYCGPPERHCSSQDFDWLYRTTVIPTRFEEYLSRWARSKYAECT